ncbi:MAG: DUF1631 family protein, partial [Moraxellaceae bacterium]
MAEQRQSDRLPLTMNVQLIARGINRRSCLMKDISPGGALLELRGTAGDDRALGRGDVVIIRMFLGEGRDIREHELRARIAHADQNLLGVTFFNPDDRTLTELLRHAAEQPARQARLDADGLLLMERLARQMLAYCRDRLPAFFARAETGLLEASDHARSNADQRLYFDAVTALRKQQPTISNRFLTALQESFGRVNAPVRKPGERVDVSGLALVDKDQFEEWLVAKVMASRAESECRHALFALQVRLDELAHCGPGHQVNPFVPSVLCEAFQYALAAARPGAAVEKILYAAFEPVMLAELPSVYEGLNQILIDAGIVPDIELSRYVAHYEHHAAFDEPEAGAAAASSEGGAPAPAAPVNGTGAGNGQFVQEAGAAAMASQAAAVPPAAPGAVAQPGLNGGGST